MNRWTLSPPEFGADRVFGVSVISCWEVAKLVEYGRLKLDRAVGPWIESALAEPGVSLLHIHPRIVVESTQLPQPFIIGCDLAGRVVEAGSTVAGFKPGDRNFVEPKQPELRNSDQLLN